MYMQALCLAVFFFFLDDFLVSEFYVPVFWNTGCSIIVGNRSEGTDLSEMSVHKIQMPGNHPKERI